MAVDLGLVAALRLPAAVFSGAVQDIEARAGRPEVRVGQAGAYGRGEVCAGGNPRFGERPLTTAPILQRVSAKADGLTLTSPGIDPGKSAAGAPLWARR